MVKFKSLGHINIVVDDLDKATAFYHEALGAEPVQEFPHFRNVGFAKAAGFLDRPAEVDVSIRFLVLPTPESIHLELMEYHTPRGKKSVPFADTNDAGGPRHICLRVENIDEAFAHLKTCEGVRMVNPSADYKPYEIDAITPDQFRFFDPALEADAEGKSRVCDIVGGIRYFYFVDPYGVQWELEQGHEDVGSEAD